jgi:uncharacterized membrane protein YcaP (DUF421 family)
MYSFIRQFADQASWLLGAAALVALAGAARPAANRQWKRLKAGFHRSVSAEPTVLVSNGKVMHRNLERLGMTVDELHSILHKHGAKSPSEAMAAFLHFDGATGVVLRRERSFSTKS